MIDHPLKHLLLPLRIKLRLKGRALAHVHPAVDLMFFSEVTNASFRGRRNGPDIMPQNGPLPSRGLEQPEQHANGSGLPRPVATQECEHAPLRHLQVQFINRSPASEIPSQTFGANDRLITHGRGLSLVSIGVVSSRKLPAVPRG